MKNFLRGFVALVFILAVGWIFSGPTAVISQTADGETPSQESVCDGLSGAAYGLCTAYCEAMDCENADPEASDSACDKVYDNYVKKTGSEPPCMDMDDCPDDLSSQGLACTTNTGNSGTCACLIELPSGNVRCDCIRDRS